jgi:hypothetical protein
MLDSKIEALLSALESVGCNPKKVGSGWDSRCPAHDDDVRSLSVGDGEKGLVLACHAGCKTEDVVARIGWTMADLFPKRPRKNGKPEPRVVSQVEWKILDTAGALVALHIRQNLDNGKKKFSWRLPDGRWQL